MRPWTTKAHNVGNVSLPECHGQTLPAILKKQAETGPQAITARPAFQDMRLCV
jgi:hypothetical protein